MKNFLIFSMSFVGTTILFLAGTSVLFFSGCKNNDNATPAPVNPPPAAVPAPIPASTTTPCPQAGYLYTQYGCLPQGSCPTGQANYNNTCVPAISGNISQFPNTYLQNQYLNYTTYPYTFYYNGYGYYPYPFGYAGDLGHSFYWYFSF